MQSVLQLPDITRPIVSLQGFQKSRCDGLSFVKAVPWISKNARPAEGYPLFFPGVVAGEWERHGSGNRNLLEFAPSLPGPSGPGLKPQ